MIQAMKVEDDDEDSEQRPSYPNKEHRDQTPAGDSDWVTCSNDRSGIKHGMSTNSRPTRLSRTAGPLQELSKKQEMSATYSIAESGDTDFYENEGDNQAAQKEIELKKQISASEDRGRALFQNDENEREKLASFFD